MREQDDDLFGDAPAAPTLVRLTSSQARVPEGASLVLAAHVTTVRGDGPPATGSVEFRVAGRWIGSASLDSAGQAVLVDVRLQPGVHAVSAAYGGDAHHAAASSSSLPQAVLAAGAPVVVLVAAPATGPDGVRLEAELVDPNSGRLAEDATGTVVFSAGNATVACVDLVSGHARALVTTLPAGRLRATFSGDPEHAPASGLFLDSAARS